jgi:two-component system, NtrC family, sensor histidine kinase KinB
MNHFRLSHLALYKKIVGGYLVTTTLLLLVCLWAIFNLYRLGQASEAILRENYRSILAAENMVAAIERQDSSTLSMLLGYDPEAEMAFRANEVEFLTWLSRAKDNITIATEPGILAEIERAYTAYLTAFSELTRLEQTDSQAAPAYYLEQVSPLFQEVRAASNALRDVNQADMVAASDRARRLSTQAIWSMSIIGGITAVFGLGFGLILSGHLVRPLEEMAAAADQIAAGHYDVTLPTQAQDEIGHLARKIVEMSRALKAFHALNVDQLLIEKQKNETIIGSIDDGIILVDNQNIIVAINPKANAIFTTTREAALGKHLFDVVGHPFICEQVNLTLENGQPPELNESETTLTITQADSTGHYQFSLSPVHLEPGHLLGVVLLFRDVTGLKEVDRLKSEFVMTASHELRTPLTSLAMSVNLLAEQTWDRLSSPEQALLTAAQEETQRLKALVNDLLDLSKIESGRLPIEPEAIDISLLVERAIDLLLNQAREKEIDLAREGSEEAILVQADPNKIVWVLTNLIANALRYTDKGGFIKVAARCHGGVVHISVRDNGAGIPWEYQSRIFDKFVQVAGEQTTGGTGLGLAISKEIVKAHRGNIWVESTPGEGSTFTFTLPAATAGGSK